MPGSVALRRRQQVVAAIIQRDDGLILVAQRNSGLHQGKWEFPGGKVELGETPQVALVREIDEELGVEIVVGEMLAQVEFSVAGAPYLLLAYLARHRHGEYRPVVHGRIEWLLPTMLPGLDLTPADLPIAVLLASPEYDAGRVPAILSVNDCSEVV